MHDEAGLRKKMYSEFAKNLKAALIAHHMRISIAYARRRYVDEEGDGDVDEPWYDMAQSLDKQAAQRFEKMLRDVMLPPSQQ